MMPRKKKKIKNPLDRFKKIATTLLENGECKYSTETIEIKEIKKVKTEKNFECILKFKNKKIEYSHVKPAKDKLEAVSLVLEHLEMMGHGGLSEDEEVEK